MILQYAITVDGDRVKQWQLECIRALQRSGLANLKAIVALPSVHPFPSAVSRSAKSQQDTALPADIQTGSLIRVSSAARTDDTLRSLRNLNLDFILQLSSYAPNEFVDLPRHGIWYFNHGDGAVFTSNSPYFWEVYEDHAVSVTMLLKRVVARENGGILLKAGYFATVRTSYERTVDMCYFRGAQWPAQVCRDIANGVAHYFEGAALPSPSRAYGTPGLTHRLKIRLVLLQRRLTAFLARFRYPYWNIALIRKRPIDLARGFGNVEMLQPHIPNEYLADPFVFEKDGALYVFCEQFSYRVNRGRIVVFELRTGVASQPSCVIEEQFHLSYPQVFEHDGVFYCIPESAQAQEVRIYEAQSFPTTWTLRARILCGFAAVDPTLLYYNSRWWLFCTRHGESQTTDLYIWHAPSLFGPWTEHVLNPVKTDVRSTRPAGCIFQYDGALFRPAQDCSRTYGGRTTINRILRLNESAFEEEIVGVVEPPRRGAYPDGLHTIAPYSGGSIVDLRRDIFSASAVTNYLKFLARRNARRLGLSDPQIEALKNSVRRFSIGRGERP